MKLKRWQSKGDLPCVALSLKSEESARSGLAAALLERPISKKERTERKRGVQCIFFNAKVVAASLWAASLG